MFGSSSTRTMGASSAVMAGPSFHLRPAPRGTGSPTIGHVTHYEVLGVDSGASASVIRRAYLGKARRVHPDYHADADAATRAKAELEMRQLNAAWEVLGDEQRRTEYDDGLRIEARRVVRERPT